MQAGNGEKLRIAFSGYEWTIKTGTRVGPGPNRWEAANVSQEERGRLRLAIRRDAMGWSCAEVALAGKRLGFGLYEFQTIGPLGRMDPNVVLGLFNYPPKDVGPDTTNEIDIEYARWGRKQNPNGNFTLWPGKTGEKQRSHSFEVPPDLDEATHRFLWLPDRIVWQTLQGHAKNPADNRGELERWEFKQSEGPDLIPRKPLPVLINLWLFQGRPPMDNNEVALTIARFTHQPRG